MMKIRVFTLFALCLFVSCTKTDVTDINGHQAMSFTISSRPSTKGYINGVTLKDTAPDSLHVTSSGAWRNLVLSGYISSQENEGNYFVGETFTHKNGKWSHDPEIYWPLGSTLNFLGFSSTIPFEPSACKWRKYNCSDKVTLMVSSDYTRDDLVYGSAWGCKSTEGSSPVAMVMKHSQAWIQLRLSVVDAVMDSVMTVDSVMITDIYTSGQLDIENNHGEAEARWDFRFETRRNTLMDDYAGTYGALLTTEPKYLDMLLPEQEKKTLVIHYRLNGSDIRLVHSIPLSLSTWLMGYRYVYDINITLNGIKVVPSVVDWTTESIDCGFN